VADLRSLVVKNGTTQGITTADTLIVGNKLDAAAGQALTVGGTNATGITIGSGLITTSFPGPVELVGDVTTVGGTTFTTDATFEGNVTFGNGPSDTVTFAATTTVVSDINFGGGSPTYKITNLADPTSAQDAATKNYVDTEISGSVNVGNTFVAVGDGTGIVGSANLTWSGTDLDVTGAINIAGGDPRALTIQDATATTDVLFYDAAVEELTIQSSVSTAVTTIGAGQNNISDTGHTAQLSVVPASSVALDFVVPVASSVVPAIIVKDGAAAPAPLKLDASEIDVNSVKIINVADGVDPTDAVNKSQLDAIVSGVSDVTATAPLLSSGGSTPDISIDTAGAANGDVLTFNAGAWAAAAPADVNVGSTFVAVGDGTGIDGSNSLTFSGGELSVNNADPVISVARSDVGNALLVLKPQSAEFSVPAAVAAFATLKASDAVSPIPLKLDASEFDVNSVKIINVADGVDPTDAVNKSQLDAIVAGVSDVTATAPLLSSGGATPDISIDTAGASNGDVLTFNAGAWAAAAPVTTPPGGPTNSIQTNDGSGGFAGSANLLWDGTAVAVSDGASTLSIDKSSVSTTAAALDLEGASSVTATITGGATYLLTPDSVQTITYAASVAVNFDPSLPQLKTVALTGDIAFTSSNLGASRNVSVRVVGDTVSRNLTSFPAGWKWLGGVTPTVLEANKVAILSLASFSTTDANVVASWSYDGSDVVTDVTASAPLASSGGATPNISLTGVIGVANGGTGQSSLTSGALVVGNGGSAVNSLSPGSNGQVLTVVGGAWAASSLPAATDYSVVALTTAQAANTAVTVAGAAAIATAASTSRVAGIVKATNSVQVLGICTCDVEGALSIAAGDAVYLSASEAGAVTNVAPSASGAVVAELGIATAASSGGAVAVLWQPKSIVVL